MINRGAGSVRRRSCRDPTRSSVQRLPLCEKVQHEQRDLCFIVPLFNPKTQVCVPCTLCMRSWIMTDVPIQHVVNVSAYRARLRVSDVLFCFVAEIAVGPFGSTPLPRHRDANTSKPQRCSSPASLSLLVASRFDRDDLGQPIPQYRPRASRRPCGYRTTLRLTSLLNLTHVFYPRRNMIDPVGPSAIHDRA